MKRFLLATTLLTTLNLSAEECEQYCESCCTPIECIDCVCYTPQYYDLDCARGLFAHADFLYWFAKETGLSYALRTQTRDPFEGTSFATASLQIVPNKYKWMEESWDYGFRVGAGFNGCCDGWDLHAYWTYFHTDDKESISVNTNDISPGATDFGNGMFPLKEILFSPWIIPPTLFSRSVSLESSDLPIFNKIQAKWSLNYNVVDLELGRKYWLSPCFSLRPYLAARGAWTKTRFSTCADFFTRFESGPVIIINDNTTNVCILNRFWGVGLLAGFQPNWHLGCGFSVFGNADVALLWGCFDIKQREQSTLIISTSVSGTTTENINRGPSTKSKNDFTAMQAIIDLGAGLRWESTFCCDRFRVSLDAGWEHHLWFDHNHRMQLRGSFERVDVVGLTDGLSFADYDETYGNLILAGLVVRARLDF